MSKPTDNQELCQLLEVAAVAQNLNARGVGLLSRAQVRAAIGQGAKGLSNALIVNLQRKVVVEMERQVLQLVADQIVSNIRPSFPHVAVQLRRGRVLTVRLDGLIEEIE